MEIFQVGGSIRDELLGIKPSDKDWVVVGSTPEEMEAKGFKAIGKDFPVFLHPKTKEAYALARTEKKSGVGYKGFTFYFDPSITLEEDLQRRDLTINAMAKDNKGKIIDPFNGKKDLENGEVKFIGDAETRIKEDYLRILRYIRFFLNYSKNDHSDEIQKIIRQNIHGVAQISSDRLLNELKKLFSSSSFLKLTKDKFCLEIINLIFPQLKNILIFKNLKSYAKEIIKSNDFIFLISLMIIDETDNSEYFLYKFNISNEGKKRIRFLNNIFSKPLDKNLFSEKNLWKILYFHGHQHLNDLINFQIVKSKKLDKKIIKIKKFFNNQSVPKFNIKAKGIMEKFNIKEGKELGQKLKEIEMFWIDNSFKIIDKQIEKIIKN